MMNGHNDLSYMDLLSSENLFVRDELNSRSPFSTFPDTAEDTNEVFIPSQGDSLDESRKKRTRKSKFTSQEDVMLVSAWLNVSLDPIIGNDQKSETYWERIHAYYEEHRQFSSNRSPNSLMHRWSAIKVAVNKFQGYISKIDSRNQSGITEQDKICQAMEMYKSLQKHPFPFIHCWKELRFTAKFDFVITKKKDKHLQSQSSHAALELISSEDNDVEIESAVERPLGRKAAKEISRKRKGKNEIIEDDTRKFLAEIIEAQKQQRVDRKATAAEFLKIKKEREERERKKEEREQMLYEQRIIRTNTSDIDQLEAEYFTYLKEAIIEKRRKDFLCKTPNYSLN